MNDPGVQTMLKRPRQYKLSTFIISQDFYELPMRTIRTNGIINHNFNLDNFRDVKNLYQDKALMDMTLNEFKYLTSILFIFYM